MERKITEELLKDFEKSMYENEKSKTTVEKYLRGLRCFADYANGRVIDKALALEYKAELCYIYALTSANSILAALNAFFYAFPVGLTARWKQFIEVKQLCPARVKHVGCLLSLR